MTRDEEDKEKILTMVVAMEAVKAEAIRQGFKKGRGGSSTMPCPMPGCAGQVVYMVSSANGHLATKCNVNGCLNVRECKGEVADTEDQEPWTVWLKMPLGSAAAVLVGIVKPIPCPECKREISEEYKRLDAQLVQKFNQKLAVNRETCPKCNSPLIAKSMDQGGGVVCTNPKCDYWDCL
jgi:ssDNA-binding Zn-finger/Zn-ribbon topoisomerase 1